MLWLWLTLAVCTLLIIVFWWIGRWAMTPAQAREQFHVQKAQLQSQFFAAASASGKPRGLRWKACDWDDSIAFAREKTSGRLAALAGVIIQFEAIEGGDMEGLPAVANLRNASAVFFLHRGRWHTTGKIVFNLNPDEVLTRFQNLYERLA